MGQKVHPLGFRLGYTKNWLSRWYSRKEYPAFVVQDDKIRKYVKEKLYQAGIAKMEIERAGGKIRLILHTARPGIVIGRKGVEIEKLRGDLKHKFGSDFTLEVTEIRQVKGLEYDYVVLVDVNASTFPVDDEARYLLHIAATRAAHQLWVLSTGTKSRLLPDWLDR